MKWAGQIHNNLARAGSGGGISTCLRHVQIRRAGTERSNVRREGMQRNHALAAGPQPVLDDIDAH